METSILYTIKEMLDVEPSNCQFDTTILVGINAEIMALTQIGVGKREDFVVTGITETWSDFLGEKEFFEAAKMCIFLKTRLVFDPPANSFVVKAFEDQLGEYEWRLMVRVDERRMSDESTNGSLSCALRRQGDEVGRKKNTRTARS